MRAVPVRERLLQNSVRCPETGCLLWQGATRRPGRTKRYGGGQPLPHGQIKFNGRKVDAHRAAFMVHHGYADCRMADFGLISHSCDNPRCIEPAHLSLSDHSQNLQEAWDRGRRNKSLEQLCAWWEENPIRVGAALPAE